MNILIIGLGSIAEKHIQAIPIANPSASIIALRSGNSANNIPSVRNISAIEELSTQPDFVIICNPTHLHYATINTFLDYNVPLFIEKPAVHNLDDLDTLLKEIKNRQLITYVACNLRFHPCIQFLKKYFSNATSIINEVNVYCGSYLPNWRSQKDFRTTYSANTSMGGGVHLDLFHELDYTCWLLGSPEKYQLTTRNVSTLSIDAVDYANYILQYKTFTVSIILNYYRRDSKRCIEIIFEDKTWTIDLLKCIIIDNTGNIVFKDSNYQVMNTYTDQMKYFISHTIEQKQPMNTLEESAQILKICLANEKIKP